MKWGQRKDRYSSTQIVLTTAKPKVGGKTLDAEGKTAVVAKVERVSNGTKKKVLKSLNMKDRPNLEAVKLTTVNEDQYNAAKKRIPLGTKLRVGALVISAGSFVVRSLLEQDDMADGQIVGHTDDGIEIQHYGLKGMRWGVRRDNPSGGGGGSTPVTAKIKPGGGIVKVKGGGGRLPSEDALNAASYKQRAAKSTVSSLDNKELQALVTRLNLEQQYSKLTVETKTKSAGRKAIEAILLNEGKSLIIKGKAGPIAGAVGGGLKATGQHRGTQTVGKVAVKSIFAAGAGKHRLA
jgi:hypothetical protein